MTDGSPWNTLWRALGAPWRAICALRDPEARRGAALLFMAAGGMAMTLFATWSLWLVRSKPRYAFYLGLAALGLVLVIFTGFTGLLVLRRVSGEWGAAKFSIEDVQAVAKAAAEGASPSAPTT